MKKKSKIDFLAMVELSKIFIQNCTTPTITIQINKGSGRTSYGYKHDVADYFCTEIDNNAFIRAAKEMGIRSKGADPGDKGNRYFSFKPKRRFQPDTIFNDEWRGTFAPASDRLNELISAKNRKITGNYEQV